MVTRRQARRLRPTRRRIREDHNNWGGYDRFDHQSANEQVPTDWSGGVILFTETAPDTGRDIWSIRVASDGSAAPDVRAQPFLTTQYEEVAARFAPGQNQRWIAYQSNDSGRPEVYIQSYPVKGQKVAVSRGGGRYPVWGPGGRELFYMTLDNQLMAVSIAEWDSGAVRLATRAILLAEDGK